MSKDTLDTLESTASEFGQRTAPPLHLWNPDLSGDIDIRIKSDGTWLHEGSPIRREALVRLFASILRREEDGQYYLVTPVEKWRISVESHALVVIDVDTEEATPDAGTLRATLNTGEQVPIDEAGALFLEPDHSGAAVLRTRNGLTALFSRPAWYRLVNTASHENGHSVVRSAGHTFDLGLTETDEET